LRNEIQSAIRKSRVLVLLWSKAASMSRWVMSETLTAFHTDCFILPCVLDKTPLPQFLQNTAYLDRRRDETQIGEKLCRAIRAAPRTANQVPPLMAGSSAQLESFTNAAVAAQYGALAAIGVDFENAAKANTAVDSAIQNLKKIWPLERKVLNLAGYQYKNNYIFKHWAAIQAGRAPKDPALQTGERCFFEALCVDPSDPSALNGLGSILMYEREFDAAEFFQRRAIELVKRAGGDYAAAQHDLDLTLYYKAQQAAKS
jgi:hypothetical protein